MIHGHPSGRPPGHPPSHPLVERYLTRFETSITELELPDREEISLEIRNHVAEARASGSALDVVLRALGPADVLARAYAAELALNTNTASTPGDNSDDDPLSPPDLIAVPTRGSVVRRNVVAGTRHVGELTAKLLGATSKLLRRRANRLRQLPRVVGRAARRVCTVLPGYGRNVAARLNQCRRAVMAAGRSAGGVLRRSFRALVALGLRPLRAVGRFMKAIALGGLRGLRAVAEFLTFMASTLVALVVGTLLAAMGFGVTLAGLIVLVVGILEAMGLVVPGIEIDAVPPAVVMALAPVAMVVGAGVFLIALRYLQGIVVRFRRRFPGTDGLELADPQLMQVQ